MRAEECLARGRRRRKIEERVTDELDRNAAVAIDRLLEGEDHQDAVGERADRLQTPLPPRPDLWPDVVDDRHAKPLDPGREAEIEIWRVDDDERVRFMGPRRPHELPERGERLRDCGQRFGESGDGNAAIVGKELATCLLKAWTAEAGHLRAGRERPELTRQGAGVQIAGS